jgi:hypothetical protein
MSFVFSIKDTYRQAVEAATGGKNTVMYDDKGNPSVMVVIPRFNIGDVIPGGSASPHPAFVVNGAVKSEIYISKYQNIVHNGRAYSIPMQDPAVYTKFDQALGYCAAKGAGWHLMTNAEWAAIALWCKKNGYMPRGNNNYGSDISAPHEKGKETYASSGKTARVATGSGPASWAHDGTNDGIFDLNGNVYEWVGGMRLNNGEIQVIPDNNAADKSVDQSAASAAWRAINLTNSGYIGGTMVAPGTTGTAKYDSVNPGTAGGLGAAQIDDVIDNSTAPASGDDGYNSMAFEALAADTGITVPEIMKALALAPIDASHGGDILYLRNYGERLPFRGGYWYDGISAGVFALNCSYTRTYSNNYVGFRSAFVSL